MTYREFLESKIDLATDSGFAVDRSKINPALKPHQSDAVAWALKGGRRALFEAFGLGKTVQEIEFCHLAAEHTGGRALIVLPLGVKQEFTRDAVELLGYEKPEYCRTMDEVKACDSQIVLTNYERVRDGDIDPSYFAATSLDEASVLRSFGSKTYQTFLDKFKNVPYKLVATATPSPNKYKELIHYAGYLEVMDTGQALTRFFQRDSTKANNLTLYPNMEDEFWLWVSSWALFVTKPSDLNPDYSDVGYDLPPLDVRWHEIPIHYGDTADRDGQMQLFQEAAEGLKEAAAVKRDSIDIRVQKMKEIVDASPDDHFLLWHDLESERHAIKKALPETVDGSNRYGLVTSFLSKFYKTGIGQDEREPLHTVTTSAGHFGEVRAFLIKYYGDATGQDIEQPLDTVTTKDRFGLVTIEGVDYQIVDIGLRMLEPRELYGCQGFPEDYIIDHDYTGKTYPRTEQVRRCGNAVCPPIPAALVRANLPEMCVARRTANMRVAEEANGQLMMFA